MGMMGTKPEFQELIPSMCKINQATNWLILQAVIFPIPEVSKSFNQPWPVYKPEPLPNTKESQRLFWGLDEEFNDSESIIEELQGKL